jgi:hypothetical protein
LKVDFSGQADIGFQWGTADRLAGLRVAGVPPPTAVRPRGDHEPDTRVRRPEQRHPVRRFGAGYRSVAERLGHLRGPKATPRRRPYRLYGGQGPSAAPPQDRPNDTIVRPRPRPTSTFRAPCRPPPMSICSFTAAAAI